MAKLTQGKARVGRPRLGRSAVRALAELARAVEADASEFAVTTAVVYWHLGPERLSQRRIAERCRDIGGDWYRTEKQVRHILESVRRDADAQAELVK